MNDIVMPRSRANKIVGPVGKPLAPCFLPKGRTSPVIYVVRLHDHPEVCKIGCTHKWKGRRKRYASWNLADGNGIAQEAVFTLTDEYVDLKKVEKYILDSAPFPLFRGREWFTAEFEMATRHVSAALEVTGLSYL